MQRVAPAQIMVPAASTTINTELKRDGYEGIFSPKSRAKTMSENDRKHVDGCAIFYRTSKFTLIKVEFIF